MDSFDSFMPKLSLAFAKIVATPTPATWSQVYNAGSLFAALSLTITEENPEEISLPALGKKLFSSLEAEFFTLEEKSLHNIKNAIKKSFENIPPGITADACYAFFKDNILYIFIFGKGKAMMKRDEKLGILLDKKESVPILEVASGYLHSGDILLLQTNHFSQNVTPEQIVDAFKLSLPNDIAESLSPHVHDKEDGGQAAIIITYNGAVKNREVIDNDKVVPPAEPHPPGPIEPDEQKSAPSPKSGFKFKFPDFRLTRLQLISLCLAFVILIVIIAGIFYTRSIQENAKYDATFKQIYPQAQKKYEEALALKKLNQSLARDGFIKTQEVLKNNLNKFKPGSKEMTQIQSLYSQIESELNTSSPTNNISLKEASVDDNNLLNIEKNNKAIAYSQDDLGFYLLTDKALSLISKAGGSKKDILINEDYWGQPVAVVPYQGNIYILDKKNGILKFVSSVSGFGKTDYFKGELPDLTKAQSMAIDGSVWLLTADGKILKYTRGQEDSFSVSGLDKPLTNPSKIYTDINSDNLYILDNGNSRLVVLSKNGSFQNQYSANEISGAKDFEIIEADQKALILSGSKIYELPLQ